MKGYALILLLLAGVATADEKEKPPLEHFAGGFRLRTEGDTAIYCAHLPAQVYRTVVRRDLGDIRVFNGKGERISHAIHRAGTVTGDETADLEVPFFPIGRGIDNVRDDENLDVVMADDGRILRIDERDDDTIPGNTDGRDYIMDLGGLERTVAELRFDLIGESSTYMKSISLQYSNDLNEWRNLVDEAILARMDYDGHSLKRNSVVLPNRDVRYLRLHWLDDPGGVRISGVRAALSTEPSTIARRWSEVEGRRSPDRERTFLFDIRGFFPVDRINLLLPEDNTLIEATLRSRGERTEPWRVRYSGLLYRLQLNGNLLKTGPVSVPAAADRYWQLQVENEGGMGAWMPVLQFAWVPDSLYFLARGGGPFVLAYGSGRVGPPGPPVESLLKVLKRDTAANVIGDARVGEPVTLMGERALAPEPTPPWRRILLWVVVIIGIVIIAVLALRWIKQSNTDN